jgi:chitinase
VTASLIAALVIVPATVITLTSPASAAACSSPAWDSAKAYSNGAEVSYNGHQYRARWWTQNETPGNHEVWSDLGGCDSTPPPGDPSPSPTPPPATPPPATPPPGGGSCGPAWNSATGYAGGSEVSYTGHEYRARWWTQNETPGNHEVWSDLGACGGTQPPPTTPPPTTPPPNNPPPGNPPPPGTAGDKLVGYFVEWGVYQRNYHVKNIVTSGSASKLTHLNYAFGNVTNGQCALGDTYADYDRFYSAGESVDGVADSWDSGSLRGNFGQLKRLKKLNPNLKILFSFGGWTWSGGFAQAAANPAAFANSCYNLLHDSRWDGVFDGIDIDWEYPNTCGLTCDASGQAGFKNLMSALRSRFGNGALVTAALTSDATSGGKMDKADYSGAAQYVDWFNVMTYDFFGGWDATGPTAPHAPLYAIPGNPLSQSGFNTDAALRKLRTLGISSNKLLIGIGFYGRGWSGVTQSAPGGSASTPAPGTYEQGIEDYKVIKDRCPATSTVAGTAYGLCNGQWWSYDTPSTIAGKMSYAKTNGLGGAFFWELSGDTSNGELISSMRNAL